MDLELTVRIDVLTDGEIEINEISVDDCPTRVARAVKDALDGDDDLHTALLAWAVDTKNEPDDDDMRDAHQDSLLGLCRKLTATADSIQAGDRAELKGCGEVLR